MLKRNTITAPDMATAKTILTEKFGVENSSWCVYCWNHSVHGVSVTYELYDEDTKAIVFAKKLLEQ